VFERLHSGGAGGWSPPRGGSGAVPLNFFLNRDDIFRDDIFDIFPRRHITRMTYFRDHMIFRWFFGTWFFANGFLFSVKELGFWTNPGHWVRVLDAAGSYMYIVL
jgi:hypothetical protein